MTEALARIVLEGALVVGLLLLGLGPLPVLVAWIAFHTVAWLFLYGGRAKVHALRNGRSDLASLEAYLAGIRAWARRQTAFSAVFLTGSGARRTFEETSDVDLYMIPRRPVLRSIATMWALRTASVLRRVPVEAHLLDDVRYLPFRAKGRCELLSLTRDPPERPRGYLVAFSGIDGSGKTTVAKRVVEALRAQGVRASYFYGHRPAYRKKVQTRSFAIAFRSFWRRSGRSLTDLRRHRYARLVFGLMTLLDYRLLMGRLRRILTPGQIVIMDRYVADVIAFIRFLGGGFEPLEGFLVGESIDPDAAILFDLRPDEAYARKQENSMEDLERYHAAYERLRKVLTLRPVDASRSVDAVAEDILRLLRSEVRLPTLAGSPPAA
jgi:dTMP kinase